MQSLTKLKFVAVTPPAAVNDNTAYTTATIDTLGWDELLILIQFGAMDIAVAAMKAQESDDSGMSGAADISGADFSVSPATLPSASDDNHYFGIHIKCGGARKRYIDLSFTAGDGAVGTYAAVTAILAKGETFPSSVADKGFTQLLTV